MTVRSELTPVARSMSIVNRLKWLTTVGIDPVFVPALITKDEHEALAVYLGAIDDLSPWAKGDQINYLLGELRHSAVRFKWSREKFGEELAALYLWLKRMYKTGERKTLEGYATTAAAWPHATRRQSDKIGFSHCKALNNRSPEERDYYLERVEAEGWTVARLCIELHIGLPVVDEESGELLLPEDSDDLYHFAPVHYPPSRQATDLFTLLSLSVQVEDKSAEWRTPHGTVKVSSRTPLVWSVEV
jgi:hypothetical protein